jgi:hypothetical protein
MGMFYLRRYADTVSKDDEIHLNHDIELLSNTIKAASEQLQYRLQQLEAQDEKGIIK